MDSKTLIFFWAKNFFVRLLVCFGSLSAWSIGFRHLNFFSNGRKTRRISTYTCWPIIPSMQWIGPIPNRFIAPHTITEPPPLLTVGLVHRWVNSSPGRLRTYVISSKTIELRFISENDLSPISKWIITILPCKSKPSFFFR